jgi:multimeric flavodoxin WrbA
MKTLLVVYHSMTGATQQMARAAAEGGGRAGQSGDVQVEVRLRHASSVEPMDIISADAYIFASPENLAAMSGMMKDFFDRCYYPALDLINGRFYGIIVCAGSDGTNAVRQIERVAKGWRLQAAQPPVIVCTHAQSSEAILAPKIILKCDLDRASDLGATIAAGLALGAY